MTGIVLLIIAAALLAYANGANDNFKAVATLCGSDTMTYRGALILATVAQLCGSLASVLLAGALLQAFGGKGLVPDTVVADPSFLTAVGIGAAVTVLLATKLGLPISTTHALIGGLAGAGLAQVPGDFAWTALGPKYFLPLLVSPLLATAASGATYPLARALRRRLGIEAETCVCAGRVQTVTAATPDERVARDDGVTITLSVNDECATTYRGSFIGLSALAVVDSLHVTSGFALGFARGLNDTPKVLALVIAASWSGVHPTLALLIVAVVMAGGGLIHSPGIARTMGRRITTMNRGQGMLANVVASGIVIGASLLGSPVSTTHVSSGAIFGIGLWSGRANWRVVSEIIAAWLVTLPIAAAAAYGVTVLVS